MGAYNGSFNPTGTEFFYTLDVPGTNALAFTQLTAAGWSTPRYVPLTGTGDFYSSLTATGEIYFNTWSNGHLYRAIPGTNGYQLQELGGNLAHRSGQGDPFVAPDASYLIFRGYGEDSLGQGDLFISFQRDGEWTPRQNLGPRINSPAQEMCPLVTPDGQYFVFASARLESPYPVSAGDPLDAVHRKFATPDNGNLNIYYLSADFIETLRAKALAGAGQASGTPRESIR